MDMKTCKKCRRVIRRGVYCDDCKPNKIKFATKIWRGWFWLWLIGAILIIINSGQEYRDFSDNKLLFLISTLGAVIFFAILALPGFYFGYTKPFKTKQIDKEEYNKAKGKWGWFLGALTVPLIIILVASIFGYINSCKPPNKEIGFRCCEPSVLPIICKDEFEIFQNKLSYSMNNSIITKEMKVDANLYSFIQPSDYYPVRDLKMGGIDVPYYYFATNKEGEEFIEMMVSQFTSDEYPTQEKMKEYVLEGIKKQGGSLPYYQQDYTTAQGNLASVMYINYTDSSFNKPSHLRIAVLHNNELFLMIKWVATQAYFDYSFEFNNMTNSVKFK